MVYSIRQPPMLPDVHGGLGQAQRGPCRSVRRVHTGHLRCTAMCPLHTGKPTPSMNGSEVHLVCGNMHRDATTLHLLKVAIQEVIMQAKFCSVGSPHIAQAGCV